MRNAKEFDPNSEFQCSRCGARKKYVLRVAGESASGTKFRLCNRCYNKSIRGPDSAGPRKFARDDRAAPPNEALLARLLAMLPALCAWQSSEPAKVKGGARRPSMWTEVAVPESGAWRVVCEVLSEAFASGAVPVLLKSRQMSESGAARHLPREWRYYRVTHHGLPAGGSVWWPAGGSVWWRDLERAIAQAMGGDS